VGLRFGRPGVRYDLLHEDVLRLRRGVATLCRLHFAAGATRVEPGVYGAPPVLTDAGQVAELDEGPTDARAYALAATHFFGGAVMGSDPARSVVGPGFEHHRVPGLFVADSSVFPSNTGVNPMLSILAVATLCGRAVVRA
jgi:choline dehydrogenase-like flavoprotein